MYIHHVVLIEQNLTETDKAAYTLRHNYMAELSPISAVSSRDEDHPPSWPNRSADSGG